MKAKSLDDGSCEYNVKGFTSRGRDFCVAYEGGYDPPDARPNPWSRIKKFHFKPTSEGLEVRVEPTASPFTKEECEESAHAECKKHKISRRSTTQVVKEACEEFAGS